jgi:polysaccharide export outer membrane protein
MITTAMLAAGAISLAGCEQSFNEEANSGGGLFAVEAVSEPASEEASQLADSVGSFISASTPGNAGYKIGPQDVLEIVVFKAPELTRVVQVADSGSVNLPLVGEVPAAGKTAQQLERDLSARLGAKYLKSPQVSIYVKEFNSQRVTIEGAVKKPGIYPIRGKNSLIQMIAAAEGLDRDTASSSVMIFRTRAGQRTAGEFNLDDIRDGRSTDPAVEDGDVIVVPTSGSKVVLQQVLKVAPALAVFRPSVW